MVSEEMGIPADFIDLFTAVELWTNITFSISQSISITARHLIG